MKNLMLFLGLFVGLIPTVYAQNKAESKFSHGILFMAGGRYDNFRRCAATSAGTKGGPIADIMLVTKYKIDDNHALTFDLPLFRPILFGLAFKMLQFEPQFTYKYSKTLNDRTNLVTGPGLGLSFHYGPDYKSKLRDLSNSFFAMGPFISYQVGLAFKNEGKVRSSLSLEGFYVPLFAKSRTTGTVLGGALLYTLYFK